jgi:hypothetical protein
MYAAERSPHSRMLFDERDAAIEIIAAEENVVEQLGHFACSQRDSWRNQRASRHRQKYSPR